VAVCVVLVVSVFSAVRRSVGLCEHVAMHISGLYAISVLDLASVRVLQHKGLRREKTFIIPWMRYHLNINMNINVNKL